MDRQKEYMEQNSKGYEGDTFIHEELKKLVDKYEIKAIIETGTFLGATTKRLAELVDFVYTIENVRENHINAVENTKEFNNIYHINCSSQDVLYDLIGSYRFRELGDRILFFLDAHWYDYCPLIDELKAIYDQRIKPVIFIHDFKVPERPDLGYDSYKGIDFDFSYIKKSIEAIYGPDGFDYHYNTKADGAKRGSIYIYPK